jgi:hypothetical protein
VRGGTKGEPRLYSPEVVKNEKFEKSFRKAFAVDTKRHWDTPRAPLI